jgi:hypothetical protein
MNKIINIPKYINHTPTFNRAIKAVNSHIKGVDHIAMRTFNPIDIYQKFKKHDYKKQPSIYQFPLFNATATYYYNPKEIARDQVPRIFVSSYNAPIYDHNISHQLDIDIIEYFMNHDDKLTYDTYLDIKKKNQFLAWTICFHDQVNHIALEVDNIELVNKKIKEAGIKLNTDNGEIKISQDGLLLQSSTMSDNVIFDFKDKKGLIPYGFVEFVERKHDHEGNKREGFEEHNALFIFNSTK